MGRTFRYLLTQVRPRTKATDALPGLFPIDSILQAWLRSKATEYALFPAAETTASKTVNRFNHQRIDALLEDPLTADEGAKYAKYITLNLSTLSPYISGPNSVKVATPLAELEAQNIKVDRAYLVSCTNSRRSDLAAAAKVFKDAAARGEPAKIAPHVSFYIAAVSHGFSFESDILTFEYRPLCRSSKLLKSKVTGKYFSMLERKRCLPAVDRV